MRKTLATCIAAGALLGTGGDALAQARDLPSIPPSAQRPGPAPPNGVPQDPQEARCQRLMREYAVSSACYARFRVRKNVGAEALDRCGPPLPDPRGTECPLKR